MADGIPENTNPFVVILNGCNNKVRLHKIAPEYFEFDSDLDMPVAKEVLKPAIPQAESEKLLRDIAKKETQIHFAVHARCAHIIPKDLEKIVPILRSHAGNHGKKGFFIPCCDDLECYYPQK